ncbi:MAG: proton-conducting transporter membrane subunit [Polymorphobacter sp.]|uniref:proton-conducting transporter transmembrane domain-containing protein n=1 Tax=Polymorphobacter sp. TaxID=1909290 RepID=UPI003A83ED55
MLLALVPLAAPIVLLGVAAMAAAAPAMRPAALLGRARRATLVSLAVAALSALLLALEGPGTSPLLGIEGLGFALRMDAPSMVMMVLVSFIGVIVLRYSCNYLDGEPGQARFTGWLLATLAAVQMLVLAGNLVQLVLAWVAMSLTLHKLLLFYADRRAAQTAATKKFWSARLGDVVLGLAAVLLAVRFGTGDIATIVAQAPTAGGGLLAPALLLALAGLLKSAQFPTHGWLIEVMETPTPVSALLHAGIVNAGGFLIIRFADVMLAAPGALMVLAIVGGFTALFGAAVMLTQPSVKVSLAWSTVSQMGFMMLQCGLGAFSIALLHIVAHSLYKAHAFLSSGSVVDRARAPSLPGFGQPLRVSDALIGLAVTLGSFAAIGRLFGHTAETSPALLALGAISVMGVAMMATQALSGETRRQMLGRTIVLTAAVALAWFTAQGVMAAITAGALPDPRALATLDGPALAIIVLAALSFMAIALAQLLAPLWLTRPSMRALRVHLANGFYANLLWDRLIGAHRV